MNQDQMYEHLRAQMRQGVETLEALSKTLLEVGNEIRPYSKGEKHLYVRCDLIPSDSIRIIDFLCFANHLNWRIVAFNRIVDFYGSKETVCTPYMNIYKEVKNG